MDRADDRFNTDETDDTEDPVAPLQHTSTRHTAPGASGTATAPARALGPGTPGHDPARMLPAPTSAGRARVAWQTVSDLLRRSAGPAARAARTWVGTRWTHSTDGLGQTHPRYAVARRWSPLVAPVVLWLVLLTLAVLLASHPGGLVHVSWRRVAALAGVLFVLGVALAVVLLDARDDSVWTATLGMGVFVYLAASVFVLFGVKAALLAMLVLAVSAFAFVRQRMHTVMEGTVHVTSLYGRTHRALMPGRNILLPGERVLAILDTQPHQHTSMPQRARRPGGVIAGAAATARYRLVPEMAELAVVATRDWEHSLRRIVDAVLLEELERWLSPEWDEDEDEDDSLDEMPLRSHDAGVSQQTPEEQVRERLERRLRDEALHLGVEIEGVRLRAATLPPREPREPAADMPATPEVVEGSLAPMQPAPPAAQATPANPWMPPLLVAPALGRLDPAQTQVLPTMEPPVAPSLAPTVPLTDGGQQMAAGPSAGPPDRPRLLGRLGNLTRRIPVFHRAQTQPPAQDEETTAQPTEQDSEPAPAPAPRTLSPSMLASMFEAVYEQRISDPATVRQIAAGFEQLAADADADPDAGLPFDPQEAARTLHHRAQELAAERGLEGGSDDTQPQRGPSRSHHVRPIPPSDPRDDNVLRGG